MASDPNAPRTRRALLTAAAGAAGAVAANAAMPFAVAAAPTPMLTETANAATAATSLTTTAATAEISFKARTVNPNAAALVGSTGDETDISTPADTAWTGVYGFSETSTDATIVAAGVWGESGDYGVIGGGGLGGVFGVGGNTGVTGIGGAGGIGVYAVGDTLTDIGLRVDGKVVFSRSGRETIGAGKSSFRKTLPGVTSSSRVFAVLHSNRANRYVRAVVPTTGSFTIYLNATVTSATYVAWFVLN